MPIAQLPERSLILIDGPDAEHFLQTIVTTDLDTLAEGEIRPGALLSPQGKILFDFLISRREGGGFTLDCSAALADDFVRRLTLYKLRAKVDISKQDQAIVVVRWGDDSASSSDESALADRRFPAVANVVRLYGGQAMPDADEAGYLRLRIAHGIAESGEDYAAGDAFPHDVLLDETGGVGFRKGCYVGQEVVSRMQHRGTARRRVMLVHGEADLPESGTEIRAAGRPIGTLGSRDGADGLAIVRIDRVGNALEAGAAIEAGDVAVSLSVPAWASYTLPQDAPAAEER